MCAADHDTARRTLGAQKKRSHKREQLLYWVCWSKWLFAAILVLGAHFSASYLVPLDDKAQQTFGGLLRWGWPWAEGDSGPLGVMTVSSGFPVSGFFVAVTSAGLFFLAALAVAEFWVPLHWWRFCAIAGAALSLFLMVMFLMLIEAKAREAGKSVGNYVRAALGLPERSPGRPTRAQLEAEQDQAWEILRGVSIRRRTSATRRGWTTTADAWCRVALIRA